MMREGGSALVFVLCFVASLSGRFENGGKLVLGGEVMAMALFVQSY